MEENHENPDNQENHENLDNQENHENPDNQVNHENQKIQSQQKWSEYKVPKKFPLEVDTEMSQILEVVKTMMRKEGASDEVVMEKLQKLQVKQWAEEAADRMVKIKSYGDLSTKLRGSAADSVSDPISRSIATVYSALLMWTSEWVRLGKIEEDKLRLAAGIEEIFKDKSPDFEFRDGAICNLVKACRRNIAGDVCKMILKEISISASNARQLKEKEIQEADKRMRRTEIVAVLGVDPKFSAIADANAGLEIEDVLFRYFAEILQPLVEVKPKCSKKMKKNRSIATNERRAESISETLKKRIEKIFEDLKTQSVRESFAHHQFRVTTVDDVTVAYRLQVFDFWVGGKVMVVGRKVVVADRCVTLGIKFEYVDV